MWLQDLHEAGRPSAGRSVEALFPPACQAEEGGCADIGFMERHQIWQHGALNGLGWLRIEAIEIVAGDFGHSG